MRRFYQALCLLLLVILVGGFLVGFVRGAITELRNPTCTDRGGHVEVVSKPTDKPILSRTVACVP